MALNYILEVVIVLCLIFQTLSQIFPCNISNCQACSFLNVCGLCNTNFILELDAVNGGFMCTQVSCPSNCQHCYQNNICEDCSIGYFLASDGSCSTTSTANQTLPANCNWGNNQSNCVICAYGYSLQSGYCYQTISLTYKDEYCLVKMDSQICQICQQYYIVGQLGKCTQNNNVYFNQGDCNIKNCIYCQSNESCGGCELGYELFYNWTAFETQCQSGQSGCSGLNQQNICSQCQYGYMLLNQTTVQCYPVSFGCDIENCITCNSPQSCGQCQPGYDLISYTTNISFTQNITMYFCQQIICPYNITNCQTCGRNFNSLYYFNEIICIQCSSSSFLNVYGYCVANITSVAIECQVYNCLSCSYPNFCSVCSTNYYLTYTGSCQPVVCSVVNCQSCSLNNICSECESGYNLTTNNISLLYSQKQYLNNPTQFLLYLLYQQCIPGGNSCNVAYCSYCQRYNSCAVCQNGYNLTMNQCSPFCYVSNCLFCANWANDTCLVCQEQYQLINGSYCQQANVSCSTGCQFSRCAYNVSSRSAICTACQQKYTLYQGQCYSTTCSIYGCSLCAGWLAPVVCLQCSQGLVLQSGYCITPSCYNSTPNCVNCLSNGTCIACQQNYNLLYNPNGTNTCLAQCGLFNCAVCQPGNTGVCLSCAMGFVNVNQNCFMQFQNCLDNTQNSLFCDLCPPPLFASSKVPGCTPQHSLNNFCDVPNCEQCFGSGKCAVCAPGYQINPLNQANFSCILNNCDKVPNCLLCDAFGSKCFFCQSGFILDNINSGGQCFLINSNYQCNVIGCAVCSSSNNQVCSECEQGYTLNSVSQSCTQNSCIQNCYLCLQNNSCTFCDTGYYLAAVDLSCQPFNSNTSSCQNQIHFCDICVTALNNEGYCLKCQNGFQFDQVNTVCSPQSNTIPNCKVQTTNNTIQSNYLPFCLVCEQGYYQNSWGLCTQYNSAINFNCPIYNCQSCAFNNQTCSKCYAPWVVAANGSCQIVCGGNCQTCQNSSYCQTCLPLYSNYEGFCIACNISNCTFCKTNNNCTICSNGTVLVNNFCITCNVSNCLSCISSNICGQCQSGYNVSSTGTACLVCNLTLLTNCISCSANNSCGLCQNGYQITNINGTNFCVSCNVSNCLQCYSNNICSSCVTGYSIVSGACVQCLYPCQKCNSDGSCSSCSQPYYFSNPNSNGSCVPNTILNCIFYDTQNNSLCSSCDFNYQVNSQGTCSPVCPSNCLGCINQNACTSCAQGFGLMNGNCQLCLVSGCANCQSDPNSCQSCFTGFYLFNSECKTCPGYCSSCENANYCLQLVSPNQNVIISVNGSSMLAVCQQNCLQCSSSNPQICLVCVDGFYLNQTAKTCQMCGQSCKTCNSTNSSQCLSCFPNYFFLNAACTACSSNCLTCANSSSLSYCTSCAQGFYLNTTNNSCTQGCPQNCIFCSSQSNCTQCLSGYTLFTLNSSVVCLPCTISCQTCVQGSPFTCLACSTGYYLSGSNCIQCSQNCNVCTSNGCISCISGYYLNSAQSCSLNCIFPCSTCLSANPGKCTGCTAGYSYNSLSNTCSQQTFCSNGCIVCPLGYTLNQSRCIQCTGSNCQSCSSSNLSQCTSCVPGFYLNFSSIQCQPCMASCSTCLSGLGCSTCSSGYTSLQTSVPTSNGIQCVSCVSPCLTCINNPNYCTSCISGYQTQGSKCIQSYNFGFSLTLLVSITTFNQNYYTFLSALVIAAGSQNQNSLILTTITNGSVTVGGNLNGGSNTGTSQNDQQYQSLTSALGKNGNIAGMKIGSSSVSVNGGSGNNGTGNGLNLILLLAICIPLGVVLVIAIIIISVCCYKRKKAAQLADIKLNFDVEMTGKSYKDSYNDNYIDSYRNKKKFDAKRSLNGDVAIN